MLKLITFGLLCHLTIHSSESATNGWITYGGSFDHSGFINDTIGKLCAFRSEWEFHLGTIHSNMVLDAEIRSIFVIKRNAINAKFELCEVGTDGGNIKGIIADDWPHCGDESEMWQLSLVGHFVTAACPSTGELRVIDHVTKASWRTKLDSRNHFYGPVGSRDHQMLFYPDLEMIKQHSVDYADAKEQIFAQLESRKVSSTLKDLALSSENRLFFLRGSLGEIDPANGKVLWETDLPMIQPYPARLVVGDFMAFFSNFPPTVTGVELNGHQKGFGWISPECGIQQGADTTPAYDPNENAVYQTCPGYVRVIDATTGLEIRQYGNCEDCIGQPIVMRDHFLVRGRSTLHLFVKTMVERPVGFIDHDEGSLLELIYFKKRIFIALSNGSVRSYSIDANCKRISKPHEEL